MEVVKAKPSTKTKLTLVKASQKKPKSFFFINPDFLPSNKVNYNIFKKSEEEREELKRLKTAFKQAVK